MRRMFSLLLFLVAFLGAPAFTTPRMPEPPQLQQTKEQTVYITRTGKKYHTATCRYLSRSKIAVSLKDAKTNGYTPCSVCKPPR